MNRDRNNFFNLVSSDQDEKAFPQPPHVRDNQQTKSRTLQNSEFSHASQSHSQSNIGCLKVLNEQFNYTDVSNFRSFKSTASLESYGFIFKEFLENAIKNVLFVFGPSGCGKTFLVETILKANLIKYGWALGRSRQNEDGQTIYDDIFDIFYREIKSKSMIRQDVILFNDFPNLTDESAPYYLQKYKEFKQNVYETIKNTKNRNKYIFILNSQIYSSFHILAENSEINNLHSLTNVSVLKMEGYGKRELKAIMQHFLKCHPTYYSVLSQAKDFQEVILEAEGDARKALHQIYYRKVAVFAQKINPISRSQAVNDYVGLLGKGKGQKREIEESRVYQYQEQVVEQKTSICHMLGKFLYGKRLNIYYNPKIKAKKDNQISVYYKEEELAKFDPKFYFKPVQMLERSRLALHTFRDLLEENFIHRYGKVKDIANMYEIFRYQDAYLEDSTNRYQLRKEMEQLMKELLTWGILIYNKNSVKASGLFKIQRSKNALNQRTIQNKLNLIKSYYLKPEYAGFFWHFRLKDVLFYAFYTKAERPTHNYSFMHQKLIEIVFYTGRSFKMSQPISSEINIMQDQQEQQVVQEGSRRINQIQEMIKSQLAKKQRLMKMVWEDSEEEDIDSD